MGDTEVKALKGVTVTINRGEYISIMGPSGSGKSTFFNMIGGLDKPSEGKVYIDEVDIAQLDSYELAWMRCRKIGYIFQTFNLIPVMTGTGERHAPDDLRRHEHGRRAGQSSGHPQARGAGSSADEQAPGNVRRPAAARGHRPRVRE
jgi:ABC-type lipoprotein export system ATPase subunit